MQNEWIVDVLRDLKKFSSTNKLEGLAEQLEDTIMVATAELAAALQPHQALAGEIDQTSRHAAGAQHSKNA